MAVMERDAEIGLRHYPEVMDPGLDVIRMMRDEQEGQAMAAAATREEQERRQREAAERLRKQLLLFDQ